MSTEVIEKIDLLVQKLQRGSQQSDRTMELSQLQSAMHRYTDAAQSVFDLFLLLRHVDIEMVKELVHTQIDKMELPTAIAAHHCALSINDVLSSDLIQHILSFKDFNRYRTVCRQWNRLNILNEEHFHRALKQSVTQRFPEIAESGNFWILNQRFFSKPRMSAVEKRAGYRGMVHSIEEVLHQNSMVFIPESVSVHERLVLKKPQAGSVGVKKWVKTKLTLVPLEDRNEKMCCSVISM